MNINNVKLAISASFLIGRTPHLIGKHGLGKSSVVRQWCEENGYTMVDVRLGQMADAGDIIGLPEFCEGENGKYTKYALPDFFPRKAKTVIFLDEINRASKDLLQAVFELVLDKSLKGVKLPPDCHVVAASNPATDDYSVLDFSDKAFQDRFIHLMFKPTAQETISYLSKKFPTSAAVAFLGEDTKCLTDSNLEDFQLDFVTPSPRSWESVMALEGMFDNGRIKKDIFREMVIGLVGVAAATAFNTYKETFVGSISAAEAIDNYTKVKDALLKAKEKNRSDILGNLLQNIEEEFTKRKGLTEQQANNVIDIVSDLSTEHGYTLCTIIVKKQACTSNVENMPDQGLLNNDRLVETMARLNKLREEGKKEIEKGAKAKPKSKKAKETEEAL